MFLGAGDSDIRLIPRDPEQERQVSEQHPRSAGQHERPHSSHGARNQRPDGNSDHSDRDDQRLAGFRSDKRERQQPQHREQHTHRTSLRPQHQSEHQPEREPEDHGIGGRGGVVGQGNTL